MGGLLHCLLFSRKSGGAPCGIHRYRAKLCLEIMKYVKKLFKPFFLLSVLLLGTLLLVGRDLTNPHDFHDRRSQAIEEHGRAAEWAYDTSRSLGIYGLWQYTQGLSLVQYSHARLELLDRAVQGQSQYVEVLRLQLAMQNMKSDFLEKDVAHLEQKLEHLKSEESELRWPASQ